MAVTVPAQGSKILYSTLRALKDAVKAECQRRVNRNPINSAAYSSTYDIGNVQNTKTIVAHYNNNATPLNYIDAATATKTAGTKITRADIKTLIDKVNTLSTIKITQDTNQAATGCFSGCLGLCWDTCVGGCKGDCGSGCAASCTGGCGATCSPGCGAGCGSGCATTCTGSCQSSCTGCGSGCAATCTGSCNTSCTGEGCYNECAGCGGNVCAAGCSSACATTCSTACTNSESVCSITA